MGRGAWAVADQALYAGANFALNVALARILLPAEYGAFTTAFVAFLLLGAVHGGVLVEPVLVFGAGRFAERRPHYLRWALAAHGRLTLVIAALLGAAGVASWLAGWPVLAAALAGFAVAQAGILLHWLLRRACHLVDRPEWAAYSGAGYLAGLVVGVALLASVGALNPLNAALLMGGASLLTAAGLAVALGIFGVRPSKGLRRAAEAGHRAYGRYAAWTGVLEWAQGALPFIVVPVIAGLDEAAHLRAAYNLAMPALQAAAAITVMMVPALVASTSPAATAWRTGRVLLAGAVLYGLVIGFAGEPAMALLYGGVYDAGPAVRWALAALPIAWVVAGMLVAVLRARENPRAVLVSRALAAAGGAPMLVVFTAWAGVAGALAAACLTLTLEAGVLGLHLVARSEQVEPDEHAGLGEPALVL